MDTVKLTILLKPGAKATRIQVNPDRSIGVAVTARPVEGKANAQLIETLARVLHIAKSSCEIVLGNTARHKVVAVTGLSREEIFKRLKQDQ